jgi:hypothetical protein
MAKLLYPMYKLKLFDPAFSLFIFLIVWGKNTQKERRKRKERKIKNLTKKQLNLITFYIFIPH